MTPDRFAQLKPIFGELLLPLQLAYALADETGRKEISFLLELLAAKAQFGITPPPKAISDGLYPLGFVYNGSQRTHRFSLGEKDWFHVGVFGMTGRGKTNTVLYLLSSLRPHRINWLVFDWKRAGYRDLLKVDENLLVFTVGRRISPFFFNPLLPPTGVETTTWIKQFIACLSHAYFLGHGCEMILLDVVHPSHTQTLRDVLAKLNSYPATSRKKDWLLSTERAIHVLCYGGISEVFNTTTPIKIEDILSHNVVFELDALSESEAIFFVEILLSAIYLYRKAHRHSGFRHVSVIEEAHNVLKTQPLVVESKSVMDKLFREIREYGESLVIVDQMPADILPAAYANTVTQITLSLKRSQDIEAVSRSMLLGQHEQVILGRLPVGHAVVKLQNRWHAPFIVAIPKVSVQSGIITDSLIGSRMARFFAQRGLKKTPSEESELFSPLSLKDKREITSPKKPQSPLAVREEERMCSQEHTFLLDIKNHPITPTTRRYQRLSLNPRRGNQIKDGLFEKGLISEVVITTTRGQVKLLQLTRTGQAVVDPTGNHAACPNPSLEHQYWCVDINHALQNKGYMVRKEHRLETGGVVDLLATKGNRVIAIEVETGKSDIVANIQKCLAGGVPRILIAATTPEAKHIVETRLQSTHLEKGAHLEIIEARHFNRTRV